MKMAYQSVELGLMAYLNRLGTADWHQNRATAWPLRGARTPGLVSRCCAEVEERVDALLLPSFTHCHSASRPLSLTKPRWTCSPLPRSSAELAPRLHHTIAPFS